MATDPSILGAINRQPTNFNLSQAGIKFKLEIHKIPNTTFFCQSVSIPGKRLGVAQQQTPLQVVPLPGVGLTYNELEVTFIVDEAFANYFEIWNWIDGLGAPRDRYQYTQLKNENNEITSQFGGLYSQATILVLDSQFNPIIKVDYTNAFPVAIGDLVLDSRNQNSGYLTCTASFEYTLQEITILTP